MTILGPTRAEPGADIFVSYAYADNEVPHGADGGWVSTMIGELRKMCRRILGGDGVNIWGDERLAAGLHIDRTLLLQARSCRTLLVVMSPGYQKSLWCKRELDAFIEQHQADGVSEGVFIVEIGDVDRGTWHPAIRQIQSISFWDSRRKGGWHLHGYPNPPRDEHAPYWERLNELAHLIADRLKAPRGALPRPAVWVAEVTDDVLAERERLIATLRQHGCAPLPEVPYPRHAEGAYREALSRDLDRCVLMVQLLGRGPGTKNPSMRVSPIALQAVVAGAAAEARNVTLLRWRPRDVVLADIKDRAYRALLTGVQTSTAEEFKRRVTRMLAKHAAGQPLVRQPADRSAGLYILVKADIVDRDLALHAQESLMDLGVDVAIAPDPQASQTPEQIRLAQEEQLRSCDAVVLVYGQTPAAWVLSQFAFSRKILARRRGGVWGALLDGPPQLKPDIGLTSPNLLLLECRRGVDAGQLERFVSTLRA